MITSLPRRDDQAGWARLLCLLGGATILIYLYLALFEPGTLQYAPFTIQDDARQFHLWMPRLVDPGLLPGDRIADYWQTVSPPLYRYLFAAATRLGIDPLLFGRLLPAPLLALALMGSWRLALRLSGNPRHAFIAAGFMLIYLLHDDSIYSASPRAFSPILLIFFLEAMLAGRTWLMMLCLLLLETTYPSSAVIAIAVLGLRQIKRGGRLGFTMSLRSVMLMAGAGIVLVAATVPFKTSTRGWGPVVTLQQALQNANTGTPTGRSAIVDDSGRIGWVCNARMGFVPEIMPCNRNIPGAPIVDVLLLVPLVLSAIKAARGKRDPETSERDLVYFHVLLATAICFAIAAVLAFQLHLPSRYSQRILGMLEWLAIGQMAAAWLDRKGRIAGAAAGGLIIISFFTPTPGFQRPLDPALIRHIAALPRNARIAGVSEELNAVPAITGRSIMGAPEQAIPWHTRYFGIIEGGLRDSLVAVSTRDPETFEAALDRLGATYLVVELPMFTTGKIPGRYGIVLPDAVEEAERSMASGKTVLATHASACTTYAGPIMMLLDVRCLRSAAIRQP